MGSAALANQKVAVKQRGSLSARANDPERQKLVQEMERLVKRAAELGRAGDPQLAQVADARNAAALRLQIFDLDAAREECGGFA